MLTILRHYNEIAALWLAAPAAVDEQKLQLQFLAAILGRLRAGGHLPFAAVAADIGAGVGGRRGRGRGRGRLAGGGAAAATATGGAGMFWATATNCGSRPSPMRPPPRRRRHWR